MLFSSPLATAPTATTTTARADGADDAPSSRTSIRGMEEAGDLDGLMNHLIDRPTERGLGVSLAIVTVCRNDRARLERAALRLIPHLNSDNLARGHIAYALGRFPEVAPPKRKESLMRFMARAGVFRGLGVLLNDQEEGVATNASFALAHILMAGRDKVQKEALAANLCPALLRLQEREGFHTRQAAFLAIRDLCNFFPKIRKQCIAHLAANPDADALFKKGQAEFPDRKVNLRPDPECCVIA